MEGICMMATLLLSAPPLDGVVALRVEVSDGGSLGSES